MSDGKNQQIFPSGFRALSWLPSQKKGLKSGAMGLS
jgi:hypothetical protein